MGTTLRLGLTGLFNSTIQLIGVGLLFSQISQAGSSPTGIQFETPKRTVEVRLDSGEPVSIQMWDEYTIVQAENKDDITEVKKMLVEVLEGTRQINPNAKFEILVLKGSHNAAVGFGNTDAAIVGEDIWTNVLGSEKNGEWSEDRSGRFLEAKKTLHELIPQELLTANTRVPVMIGTVSNDHKASTISYTIIRTLSIYGVQQVSFVVGAGLPMFQSFFAAALSGAMSGFLQYQHAKFVNWMAGYGLNPMNPQLESKNKVAKALRGVSRKSSDVAEWLHKRSYFHNKEDHTILKTLEKLGLKWPLSIVADPMYFAAHLLQPVNPKKKGAWSEGIAKDFLVSVLYYGSVRLSLGMADPTILADIGGFFQDMLVTAAKGAGTEGVAHFALASITRRFIEKDPSRKSQITLYSERTMVAFSLLLTSVISLEILGLPFADQSLTVIAVTGGAAWALSRFEFTSNALLNPILSSIGKLIHRLSRTGGAIYEKLNGPALVAVAQFFLKNRFLNHSFLSSLLNGIKSRLHKSPIEETPELHERWNELKLEFESRRHVFGGSCRGLFAF